MLAIIPARAGSKGVVNKNLKMLFNKPLIAHTILSAIESKGIDRIVVSTDSEEIAKIAIQYGAEVPALRPANISQDNSKILDSYKFILNELKKVGDVYQSFVALQPTSPFRSVTDIDEAILLYKKNNIDSVVSFVKQSHPIEWSRVIHKDNTFSDLGLNIIANRQMYKETYHFNGAIFVINSKLLKQDKFYTKNSLAYIMPRSRSLDIDTDEDFLYAEFLIQKNNSN